MPECLPANQTAGFRLILCQSQAGCDRRLAIDAKLNLVKTGSAKPSEAPLGVMAAEALSAANGNAFGQLFHTAEAERGERTLRDRR